MKRTNLAKRLGIASLCLATAVSAFSGLAATASNVASAESTIQTTDFIHTSANVTKETRDVHIKKAPATASNIVKDQSCLRISSNEAYAGTFKQVFSGDTELRFAFPDERPEGVTETYGDFKFRITDATDDSEFFEIVYQRTANGTTMYVEWNGHTYQTYATSPTAKDGVPAAKYYYYDTIETVGSVNVAPAFMGVDPSYAYDTREGKLSLLWTDDVLRVTTNSTAKQDASDSITAIVAKFDGTYDPTASKNGFVGASKWGLPKMTFENGYTISFSSEYEKSGVADKATDVSFWKITSNGTTYTFAGDTIAKDATMEAFEAGFDALTAANVPAQAAGKVWIGWKNTDSNNLYPACSAMQKGKYEACVIDYDTVNGASVRLAGRSGIRFQSMFDAEQFTSLRKYFKSFGTLIAYTETLTNVGKDFTIANYQDQETFKMVENTKGVFDYAVGGKAYKAYTMGLVDIADYTRSYSARGYLEIAYSNHISAIVYTDFNQADNSRTIAEVAYRLKTIGVDEYNAMTDGQKAIIDAYAAAYVA